MRTIRDKTMLVFFQTFIKLGKIHDIHYTYANSDNISLSSLSLTKHINDFLDALFEISMYITLFYVYQSQATQLRLTKKWLIIPNRYSKLFPSVVSNQ